MTALVECRAFSFAYEKRQILRDINYSLKAGQWLSVLGPNGSGKSTLLKCLLRLIRGHYSGQLLLAGKPLGEYKQKHLARVAAYMPQAGGRIPFCTVEEFLWLSRYPFQSDPWSRTAHDRAIMDAALEMTGMTNLAGINMSKLSGGQRQRAFLAAALAQDAKLLLLDEPASFLDPEHACAMQILLKRLRMERNLTIIAVTHDLSAPLDVGGLALVLRQGRQIHFGPVEDLLQATILEDAFQRKFYYLRHPATGKTIIVP